MIVITNKIMWQSAKSTNYFHLALISVWDYPNKQISPRVRTPAVLAILSNSISANALRPRSTTIWGVFF